MKQTRRKLFLSVHVLAAGLAACADPADHQPATASTYQAIGVPQNGFPSWDERLILVYTNRARADPGAEATAICGGGCTAYPASKAVIHDYNLARAARFHSTSLLKTGSGLMHDSVCNLVPNLGSIYPGSCDGSPSCACQGGTASCVCGTGGGPYCTCSGGPCTSTGARISLFGGGYAGENAAAGNSDPIKTFNQWVKSSGHWSNVNKSTHGKLGVGHFVGPGGCKNWTFWVQVFGGGSHAEKLAGGAHYPRSGGPATQFAFRANYYDPGGSAPQLATVNINGTCYPMTTERGSATSGTYLVNQAIASTGCHHYYFYFRDSAGNLVTFPTSGSFGVGVNDGSCADYSGSNRPAAGAGCGGCTTDGDCQDGNPCTTDKCSGNKCQNTAVAGCCTSAAQCSDSKVCTADTCVANKCQNTAVAGCCTSAAQCDDSKICTADKCTANKCQNTAVAGCCTASSQCDDKDPCTTDSCSTNTCSHAKLSGCCKQDSECDDKSACTADTCVANKCAHKTIAGCCAKDADCADNNPCTTETCVLPQGNCSITQVAGCCTVDTDCVSAGPCSTGKCNKATNRCEQSSIPGCQTDAGSNDGAADSGPIVRSTPESKMLLGSCTVGDGQPGRIAWVGPIALVLLGLLIVRRRR